MNSSGIVPLIFTDLDGTLLDHDTYSSSPADRLIARVQAHNLAYIIPVTSKTRSELHALRQSIPLAYTLGVTENGSVVEDVIGGTISDLSDGKTEPYAHILGLSYASILAAIDALPNGLRCHFKGFADMNVADIAHSTGLATPDAERARQREASEPFLWSGSDQQMIMLTMHMSEANLRIQRGGRFYHLTGHATKEMAMGKIASAFAQKWPKHKIISIALGDGPNDLAMIEAADIGVIMPNPKGVTILSDAPHIQTAPYPGPKGWNAAVQNILSKLGFNLSES